ncbi:ABC transporter ATP-binding protein [Paenibacillus thiaminolyticus]|uniref:ABC transporter ATP-binding protein n=1 Tax=Paenibacillus thiaminolyticus TaxID=49283 RepID=UPI00233067D9|nr:ABC transporter ATP-binding protein [Paenibacillus thiaminolyticus]WCF09916.1 ABC transporter ATP-binding protein [Paenibacillus thiaminolyticus]
MADISLANITMNYKGKAALNNVSLEVKDKEFFVVFGPAGAGKTTLLNVIAGIVLPSEGVVRMNGNVINAMEPEERNVAMVFENYALYPHLTVFDNMASPLRSPTYREPDSVIREEVRRVARILRIDGLLERLPSELSNGQQQRVSLGRALVRKPEVFLMDEPLTHLDAKLRHQMRAEFKEMQQSLNTTTIYVTHDYLEALSLGDRIAVIHQGRIEQVGKPDDIYYRPATEYVAEAFGEPEINLLDADIIRRPEAAYLNLLGDSGHFSVPGDVLERIDQAGCPAVRVGFRPRDISYSFEEDPEGSLEARIYSFEPLGAKAILTVERNGRQIRLTAPADLECSMDEPIYLTFNTAEALFFDSSTRRFLGRSGEKGGGKDGGTHH